MHWNEHIVYFSLSPLLLVSPLQIPPSLRRMWRRWWGRWKTGWGWPEEMVSSHLALDFQTPSY